MRWLHVSAKARANGIIVSAAVRRLPAGAYTVRWHALSGDGHVVSGVWTFGVRVVAPPPTEAYGAGGPTDTEHVVRWLYFLALALVIGSLGFRLVCLRGLSLPPPLERRLYLVSTIGAIGVLELGIVAFCLRCEDVLQLPFGNFLYGDLSPISGGTGRRSSRAIAGLTTIPPGLRPATVLPTPSSSRPASGTSGCAIRPGAASIR